MSGPAAYWTRIAAAAWLLAASVAAAEEHVVRQQGREFHPGTLVIRPGDSVVFTNEDDVTHNVFSRSDGYEFNLRMQQPGEDKEGVAFSEPGSVDVRCAIHPKMHLQVTVE